MASKAYDAYNLLHGVVCLYKPPGISYKTALSTLKLNICKDLNLEERPPRPYLDIDRSSSKISIKVRPSYADNVLCSGARFKNRHFVCDPINPLSDLMSGVLLVGINEGQNLSLVLRRLNLTRCYHLKGLLGQATANFHIDATVVGRAKYEKVCRHKFEKILANYQSSTQRKLFDEYGISLQSQEAYELAIQGLYRPGWKGSPIIYSLKTVDFQPPNFTLEVQCIHETEAHLLHLIHNLGLNLKCYATCTGIRTIRQGCFHVEHSLVQRQWTLNNVLDNIKLCWDILENKYPESFEFSRTVSTQKRQENC